MPHTKNHDTFDVESFDGEFSAEHSTSGSKSSEGRPFDASNKSTSTVRKEDSCVKGLRVSVVVVLVLAAVSCAAVVYLSLKASQTKEFETRFQDQSSHVGHAVHAEVNSKLSAMDSLAITIQSYANSRDIGWPFVTLPEFPYRATSALTLGRGISLALHPIIRDDTREWEEYSVENQGWRQQGMMFDMMFPGAIGGGGGGHGMGGHRRMQDMVMVDMDMAGDNGGEEMNHSDMNMGGDSSAEQMDHSDMNMGGDHSDMNNMGGDSNVNQVGHSDMSMDHGVDMGDQGHGGGGMDMTMLAHGKIDQNISDFIFTVDHGDVLPSNEPGQTYLPLWQHMPVHGGFAWVNYDLLKDQPSIGSVRHVISSEQAVVAEWFELADAENG